MELNSIVISNIEMVKNLPNKFSFKYFHSEMLSRFLLRTSKIIDTTLDTPTNSPLKFNLSEEAAIHNMNLLMQHGNSIQRFIEKYPGLFISPGSEFCPV